MAVQDTWTVVQVIAAKFKPFIFPVWGFCVVEYCVHFHFRDYEWYLLVFCTILLCNRKLTELGKLYAYLESMCVLENCQWCVEPSFSLAAISTDGFLPQIPTRWKISGPLLLITSRYRLLRKHFLLSPSVLVTMEICIVARIPETIRLWFHGLGVDQHETPLLFMRYHGTRPVITQWEAVTVWWLRS
jgi:hypothetical protein